MYNEAYILVEVNDIGAQVADILHNDLEYENLIATSVKGRAGQQVSGGFSTGTQFGVRTTKQVKRIGTSNLKDLIENDKLIIEDFDVITELASFIGKGTSYEAEEGAHDDLVMTCVLFAWLVRQTYFRDITDVDIRQKMYEEKIKMLEDEQLPFGIIDDGGMPEEGIINGPEDISDYINQSNRDGSKMLKNINTE